MKTLSALFVAATFAVAATASTAAVLEVRDPAAASAPRVLNSGAPTAPFDLDGNPTYLSLVPAGTGRDGDTVDVFTGVAKTASNGLFINQFSTITFTYLGSDANFVNLAIEVQNDVVLFTNRFPVGGPAVSMVGDSVTGFTFGPGFLPFAYESTGVGRISNNGGATDTSLEIAYSRSFVDALTPLGGESINIFFGDSGTSPSGGLSFDGDLDDMAVRIDVAPVPLPAAGMLLLAAIGGLGVLSRRRARA